MTSAGRPSTVAVVAPGAVGEGGADDALPGPVDLGFGVHALADAQRLLDQLVQDPAGGALFGGGA